MKAAKKIMEREDDLNGDLQGDLADEIKDPRVRAAMDKIFEEIWQEAKKEDGVPARAYMEELRARLRDGKPL